MYVCETCHADEKEYPLFHFTRSTGNCEVCGKTRTCFDCNCHKHKSNDTEPDKKA